MRRIITRVVTGIGFALVLAGCHQNGTVFAVDTTDDTIDVSPGDGLCADANGDCSLRAAVMEANELPGVEEIRLVDGATYAIRTDFAPPAEDDPAVHDLDVTSGVVVTGKGVVAGNSAAAIFDVRAAGLVEFVGTRFDEAGIVTRAGSATLLTEVEVLEVGHVRPFLSVEDATVVALDSTIVDSGFSTAIELDGGTLTMENVTMSLGGTDGGCCPSGVGLVVRDGVATINSSTIIDAELINESGSGALVISRSILDEDCTGEIVSGGGNVGFSARDCGLDGPGDIDTNEFWAFTTNLADHGGPVRTYALGASHLAVDVGAAPCTMSGADARGEPRAVGAGCDAGAFELQTGIDCAQPGPGADLRSCDFAGAVLDGIDLTGADATAADFSGASVQDAVLAGAVFRGAFVDEARFDRSDLTDAVLEDTIGGFHANDANLTRADLDGAAVRGADRADFTDVSGFRFGTWYPGGSMVDAHIEGADFTDAYFWGVRSGGVTGNATFSGGRGVVGGYILDQFVVLEGVDFSGLDFGDVGVQQLRFYDSQLTGVTISRGSWASRYNGSTIDAATLAGLYMDNSIFDDTTIVDTDMSGSDIASASFERALLVRVDFTDSNLDGTSFRDAIMRGNIWSNTICPSGVNSDDNGGDCVGQWYGNATPIE
ncbi:MAG: pentapeptide repeat-containing protein [Actinomycetota bacterium]